MRIEGLHQVALHVGHPRGKAQHDGRSPRIGKHLKASPRRWDPDVRLKSAGEVDAEFTRWLKQSYEISA